MDGNLAMANHIVFAGPHDFEPYENLKDKMQIHRVVIEQNGDYSLTAFKVASMQESSHTKDKENYNTYIYYVGDGNKLPIDILESSPFTVMDYIDPNTKKWIKSVGFFLEGDTAEEYMNNILKLREREMSQIKLGEEYLNKDKVEKILIDQLNEGLESINADGSFKVLKTDLGNKKFIVEFEITVVEDDKYIGITGY